MKLAKNTIKVKTNKLGAHYFIRNHKIYYRERDLCCIHGSNYKASGELTCSGPRLGIIKGSDRKFFRGYGLCVWERSIYVSEDLVKLYIELRSNHKGTWHSRGAKAIAELFNMEVKVSDKGRKRCKEHKPAKTVKIDTTATKAAVNININKVKTLVVVANEAK